MTTIVYTDGACKGNPGPGGWAWVTAPDGQPSGSGGVTRTTNQRMELTAALEACRHYPTGDLTIVTDSRYLVDCFGKRWWKGWQRNGWQNAQGKPVANRDLWEPLLAAVAGRTVQFDWVKGHSGDPLNEAADRLAVAAVPTPRPGFADFAAEPF